jgi:hypothetical protein
MAVVMAVVMGRTTALIRVESPAEIAMTDGKQLHDLLWQAPCQFA